MSPAMNSGGPPADGRPLGVSFSGGGFRAAAFALGVVHYLNDTDRLKNLRAISSVSGGSITNGLLASRMVGQEGDDDRSQRRRHLSMLGSGLANTSVFHGATVTFVALGVALTVMAQLLQVKWLWWDGYDVPNRWNWRTLAMISIVLTVLYMSSVIPLMIKNRIIVLLGNRRYLGDSAPLVAEMWAQSKGPKLVDLATSPYAPVFCATDLATGTPFFISTRFVAGSSALLEGPQTANGGSERPMVAGSAENLRLADAIVASAAFPGLLPPSFFRSRDLGLPLREGSVLAKTCLADGGLRDNLGVSFFVRWKRRALPTSVLADLGTPPEEVLVVNSGVPTRKSPRPGPFRRFRTVALCVDVIHQSNSQAIRENLERDLDGSACVVSINDDPWRVLHGAPVTTQTEQARRILQELTDTKRTMSQSWWCSVAQELNPSIRTRLRSLGGTNTARLMFQAYVSTMVRTAAEFGWTPPTKLPSLDDFEELCAKRSSRKWKSYMPEWPCEPSEPLFDADLNHGADEGTVAETAASAMSAGADRATEPDGLTGTPVGAAPET